MRIIYSLFLAVLFYSPCVFGQEGDRLRDKSSFQLSIGIARTGLYDHPVITIGYEEGGFPLEQKASTGWHANLSFFQKLSKYNSLKAGLGIGSYQFRETGMQGNGDATFSPYSGKSEWWHTEFSVGFRRVFYPEKTFSFLVESEAIYDLNARAFSPVDGGFALQQKAGVTIGVSDMCRLVVTGFFKSGVTRYNELRYGKPFIPYAYGLQVGVIGRR